MYPKLKAEQIEHRKEKQAARLGNLTVKQIAGKKEYDAARFKKKTQTEKDQFVDEFKRNNSNAAPEEVEKAFIVDKKEKAATKRTAKTMLSLRTTQTP